MPGTAGSGSEEISLYEGLLTTRAIRRYTKNEPIPDESAAATSSSPPPEAPSCGSNRQPFRFIVLTDGPGGPGRPSD